MAQIYGELIRAQLQSSATDLTPTATGLVYFNTSTGLKWYTGSAWKIAADLDSTQNFAAKTLDATCSVDIAALPIISPSKGGTGKANNDLATMTRNGNHGLTITTSATTDVTFPTTGTLATLDGTETLTNKSVTSTAALTGALKLPVGNSTTERPSGTAAQLKGMVRYNDTDDVFEGYNELSGWSSIGGGGTTDRVTQASHGFVVGDVLYLNGSTYAKAIATAANTAEVVGVVSRVIDASTFEVTLSGEVSGLSGLTVGEVYFLSAATAGATTITEPSVVGQVSLPVGIASSATTMYVAPKRGILIGATNVRTQISLANNATTTIQNVSAYEAGELSGWVAIAATTSLKFFVSAQFSKNGAGNNYNISYQTSGDAPPVGFQITVTAAGLIQCVMPSVTGFASASINYGLDVAAIGATLPLSISARNVIGDITGTAVPAGYIGETRTFTNRSISAVTSGMTANASPLDTLPQGKWQVFHYMICSGASGATFAEAIIASNSNNDATGALSPYGTGNTTNLTGSSWTFPCPPFVLDVASSQSLYAKAVTYGANRTVIIYGYAIRIA